MSRRSRLSKPIVTARQSHARYLERSASGLVRETVAIRPTFSRKLGAKRSSGGTRRAMAEEKTSGHEIAFSLVSQDIHAFFGSFAPVSCPIRHAACNVFSLQRLGIGVSSCREAQAPRQPNPSWTTLSSDSLPYVEATRIIGCRCDRDCHTVHRRGHPNEVSLVIPGAICTRCRR
jgi:hypothetical protein